jgi:hypothetical protein
MAQCVLDPPPHYDLVTLPSLTSTLRSCFFRLNPHSNSASSAAPSDSLSPPTKIFLTSRTHSQLSQLLSELHKTPFAAHIRTVTLGSRKNLCINDDVRKGGDLGLDERCLDLQQQKGEKKVEGKGKKGGGGGCEYLEKVEGGWGGGEEKAVGEKMRGFGERVLATVHDIEDLVVLGRETKVCTSDFLFHFSFVPFTTRCGC